MVLGAIEQRSS